VRWNKIILLFNPKDKINIEFNTFYFPSPNLLPHERAFSRVKGMSNLLSSALLIKPATSLTNFLYN
jgi:hypothetical protein